MHRNRGKRRGTWRVPAVVALLILGLTLPTLAATTGDDLAQLVRENRMAKLLYEMNLTAEQKQNLSQLLHDIKAYRTEHSEALATLLTQRRDAYLAGEVDKIKAAEDGLQKLREEAVTAHREKVQAFTEGLTERQVILLHQLIGRAGVFGGPEMPGGAGPAMGPGARGSWMPRQGFSKGPSNGPQERVGPMAGAPGVHKMGGGRRFDARGAYRFGMKDLEPGDVERGRSMRMHDPMRRDGIDILLQLLQSNE